MKEWKPEVKRDRNIWEFQRGYHVYAAGQHESNDQFNAFSYTCMASAVWPRLQRRTQQFTRHDLKWAKKYQWERRAAAWDTKQMALAVRDANKIERKRQRDSIEEYRRANEDQAKMMMEVSADLMAIIQKRIIQADAEGENIPMGLLSGLMRAAANISDSGRQSWATCPGCWSAHAGG